MRSGGSQHQRIPSRRCSDVVRGCIVHWGTNSSMDTSECGRPIRDKRHRMCTNLRPHKHRDPNRLKLEICKEEIFNLNVFERGRVWCRDCNLHESVVGHESKRYEMLKPDMLYASSLKKCSRVAPECATTSGILRIEKLLLYISPLRKSRKVN